MKIIDGQNAVLGRLASYAAKESLKGEEIEYLEEYFNYLRKPDVHKENIQYFLERLKKLFMEDLLKLINLKKHKKILINLILLKKKKKKFTNFQKIQKFMIN